MGGDPRSLVSPFGLFLMRVYTQTSVSDELIKAGRIDGAGEVRIFMQIVLRTLAPAMITVLLFTLVATWNNYFLPLIMLHKPDLYPSPVGLAQWSATERGVAPARTRYRWRLVVTVSPSSIIPLVARLRHPAAVLAVRTLSGERQGSTPDRPTLAHTRKKAC